MIPTGGNRIGMLNNHHRRLSTPIKEPHSVPTRLYFPESWWRCIDLPIPPIFTDTFLGRVFGWLGNTVVTWRGVVHVTPRGETQYGYARGETLVMLGHEAYHAEEQRRYGFCLWLPAYILIKVAGFYWGARARRHPMERRAYAYGQQVRERLWHVIGEAERSLRERPWSPP